MNNPLTLSQLGLYNPQRLNDETVQKLFIVRQNVFEFLMNKLQQESPNSIPQHYLIIAQRGMGKTTLLKRIEVELRQSQYTDRFIPLIFPEEQYNLSNLAELWLNCLDSLADTLELQKQPEFVAEIDQKVKELSRMAQADEMANAAHDFFMDISQRIAKRPVLLMDNLSLVFGRLDIAEQHRLRAWLMQNNAPILVGASAVSMEATYSYGAPFYDAFQTLHLSKLSFEELLEMLKQLAILTDAPDVQRSIYQQLPRLKTIHQLTGGNPRTAVMLFKLIVKGFSQEINDDLEALLDDITPLYKARFEELSPQMQKIVDTIALHWDPMYLELIRNETRLENGQLSPQLKRLVEVGWLEKLEAYEVKGAAYEISERFFNIWFLMRRSTRRQKRELLCLSRFLESLYGEELPNIARERLQTGKHSLDALTYDLAMAEALKTQPELQELLRKKSYKKLRELAKTQPEILEMFDVPEEKLGELWSKLEEAIENKHYLLQETILLEMTELNPNFEYAWNGLGNLYKNYFQKYEEAEKAYLKAIELNPNTEYVWYNLGNLYKNQFQKYEESEKAYLKAIEINPNDEDPWNNLGNLYQDHFQKYKESEEAYLKAIEINPNFEYAWNNLGNLYQDHLQKYEKSEEAYWKAIELNSKYEYVWYNLGNLYQEYFQKYKEAEEAYLKAIELNPNFEYAWNNLGYLYQEYFQKYKEAEKAYLKVIELNPNHGYYWNNLGNLYQEYFQKYKEAEKAYLKAIELNPDYANAWNGLGNLYQEYFQKYEEAENSYLKAIEINPKYQYSKYNLIFLYRDKLNKLVQAKLLFDEMKPEGDLVDTYYLNQTLFALYDKNLGIATESLEKALAVIKNELPAHTQVNWWRFGAVVSRLGYTAWALEVLQKGGYDVVLAPYFVALRAMSESNQEGYLNSKAVEIREPARKIIEKMKQYQ